MSYSSTVFKPSEDAFRPPKTYILLLTVDEVVKPLEIEAFAPDVHVSVAGSYISTLFVYVVFKIKGSPVLPPITYILPFTISVEKTDLAVGILFFFVHTLLSIS
ncbi:hypothetical protein D3C73_1271740 [compost metagenome]